MEVAGGYQIAFGLVPQETLGLHVRQAIEVEIRPARAGLRHPDRVRSGSHSRLASAG